MFGAKTRQVNRLKEELRLSQEQTESAKETLKRINEARKRDAKQADIKIAALKDQIANLEAENQVLLEASKMLNKDVERLRKYERKRDPKTGRYIGKRIVHQTNK